MHQLPDTGCFTQRNHIICEQGNICRLPQSVLDYSRPLDQLHKTCLECRYTYWPNVRPLLHSLAMVKQNDWPKGTLASRYKLWNPVLRKVVLSMPWRRNRVEVQPHKFLTFATKWRTVVNSTPQPFYPPRKNPCSLWIRGWVVLQPVWTFQRREKLHVSIWGPKLVPCSL
jgi:hypothetical protein